VNKSIFLMIGVLFFTSSCLEKESSTPDLISSQVREKISHKKNDHILAKKEVSLYPNQTSGVVEIKITPQEKFIALWDYEKTIEHEDNTNSKSGEKCKVSYFRYIDFVRSNQIYSEQLQESDITVLLDDKEMKYSKNLRWTILSDSVYLRINQDFFKASKITLINNTVKEIYSIKQERSHCHKNQGQEISISFSGDQKSQSEYYTFSYLIL